MHPDKVFLVTRRAGYNFGSSLQAYALQQIFKNKGIPCEILNVKEMRFRGIVRILFLDIMGSMLKVLPFFKFFMTGTLYKRLVEARVQRSEFNRFNNEKLNISPRRLYSKKRLRKYVSGNNLIVCGSDQIWNPLCFNPVMFLSFADSRTNRLAAYAPSFGLAELSSHREEIRALLNRLHHISVREKAGADIIQGLCGKKVPVVLDPTLMLPREEWKNIEEYVALPETKFILCYFLQTNIIPSKYISTIRDTEKAVIINVQTNYSAIHIDNAINRSDIGPGKFLYLISHAHMVITNSFHCCIFAHMYGKDFRVFSRFAQNDKANQNSRIETLLNVIGERHRWVNGEQASSEVSVSGCESEMRKISNDYLDLILR